MKMHLLSQFDLHQRLYNNVLEGLTDEDTNQRVNGNTQMNHIKYIAGHLLSVQYGFAFLGGVPAEVKWEDLFAGPGLTKARDDISYPHIDDIKSEWNRIHKEIRSGLKKLDPEVLNNGPQPPLDGVIRDSTLKALFDNTVAGLWAFFNHHQAYHIGQIGILRRGLDKPAMHYNEPAIYSRESK